MSGLRADRPKLTEALAHATEIDVLVVGASISWVAPCLT
jgi:hypothetical protein